MKAFKIIILTLLTCVFIAYGIGFMAYQGLNSTVMTQQYHRSVVREYGIPRLVHGELSQMIPEVVRDGLTGGNPVTDPAQRAAVDGQVELISNAITDALDESWIEEQVVLVTDDVVTLLRGERNTLTAVVDISGKLGEIEQNIAIGLETFSDAELMAMFGAPRAYIPAIAEQIVGQLGLPESLVLSDLVDDMAPGTIEMIQEYLGTLNMTFGILFWVVFIVFLVLCMLFWRVGAGLQWFGISTALTGGIFLISTMYLSKLSAIENLSGADFEALPVPSSTVESIVSFTFSKMNQMPIIFIVGGFVLFVVGLLLYRKRKLAN